MTQLELSEKFKSQLKKLKDEEIQTRIKTVLKELLANPHGGKPLRYSLKGLRAIRIGNFRKSLTKNGAADVDYFILHTGQHYSYNMDRVFFERLELPETGKIII